MAQQIWRGSISFGLVNVAVKAYSATRDQKVHFHQIDRQSGSRIGYDKVAKSTGEKVQQSDIVLGYEIDPDRYVTFDPDEVEALRPKSTRTIEISDFVDLAQIDPIYYERTYWLVPAEETAQKAYRLLAAAMEREQRVGIGTVVMRTKQYLAAIRPIDGALAMSTMRFADEVVDRSSMSDLPEPVEPPEKELALATQIIENLATDWDPDQYRDSFNDDLRSLIEKKAAGDEILESDSSEESSGAQVVDLMEALKASVAAAKQRPRSGAATDDAAG